MGILRLLIPTLLSIVGSGQVNVWTGRGPEGGIAQRPVIDPRNPGTIYTAAGTRQYKTTDGGAHWSVFASEQQVIAVDPSDSNTLYGPPGYISTDGGLTWSKPGPGLPSPCGSLSFVIDPSNTSTLYAGCAGTTVNGGGVFKSTDGGVTWNAASSGLPVFQPYPSEPWPPNTPVNALAIDPEHPRTLYVVIGLSVSAGGGLFQSTDGAASWNAVNNGLTDNFFINALAVDPRNPETLYVAGGPGVFQSIDGAASWTRAGSVFNVRTLALDPLDSGTVYALNDRGILKSMDGGMNWNVVSADVTGNDGFSWLVVAPGQGGPGTVYAAGNARGVFLSADGGATWGLANTGMFATWVDSLAIDPENPATLFAGTDSGLFRSSDAAGSWTAVPALQGITFAVAVYPQNSGIVYAVGYPSPQKSLDGGQSWAPLPFDLGDYGFWEFAIDPQNPGTLYVDGFKSTDGGAHFANMANFPGFLSALAIDPRTPGTLYAGSVSGGIGAPAASVSSGILKSVDGGQTWSGVNTVWSRVAVTAISVDPGNSSVAYATIGSLDCEVYLCSGAVPATDVTQLLGVYRTGDGGSSWTKLDLPGDPNARLLGIDQRGSLYVTTWSPSPYMLFRSQDGGATWNALPAAGLPAQISVLAFDPLNANHVFAGTYGAGVFEITLAP